jgi:hypothetical protein
LLFQRSYRAGGRAGGFLAMAAHLAHVHFIAVFRFYQFDAGEIFRVELIGLSYREAVYGLAGFPACPAADACGKIDKQCV